MKKFDFVKNKKISFIIVAVIVVIGLLSFFIRGFNIDIDFSGGTEIQMNIGKTVTPDICKQINDIIKDKLGQKYVSSTTKSGADENTAIIRTGSSELTNDQQDLLIKELEKTFDLNREETEMQITSVSPSIGNNMKKTAALSTIIATVLMLVYISVRFKIASGVAAVLCLCHDMFVMLTVYSLFSIPINANIIAAFLTILGYSINATIVVFDRVRENMKRSGADASFGSVVNNSIHQTLSRSINTTLTTLFTIGMIYIFGVESIRNFALPLIIGIVAGLFSSVCLSGPIWTLIDSKFSKKDKADKKEKKSKKQGKAAA